MKQNRSLQELTLKDNFLFSAVMMETENCRKLLEMILQFPIERVEVSKEKSIIYHPEYKGVRLDVYAQDTMNTRYNVEMQSVRKPVLGKRARYYQSQMDMESLLVGKDYSELPDSYVIFICDFDPFGFGKYRYSFENNCTEDARLRLQDGGHIIFLSTAGKNEDEVPKEMVSFLNYVRADLKESVVRSEDAFVSQLQETVARIKASREMGERFMIFQEMLRDERMEGKAEGKIEGKIDSVLMILHNLGDVPQELQEVIRNEKSVDKLNEWLICAAEVESVEHFQKLLEQ